MPSLESIGIALGTLLSGLGIGFGAGRKKGRQANGEQPSMDLEEWHTWRRSVDDRLRGGELGAALQKQSIEGMSKQLDSLAANVDKLLSQVIELRIELGQHPEKQ